MARNFTVEQLLTRLRELCDLVGDPSFSDAALMRLLSAAYAKFYTELVKHNLGYASETTVTWATDGLVQTKALATDFFGLVSVEFQQGQYWTPLDDVDARELAYVQGSGSQAYWYRLVGSNLVLHPLPAVGTYRYTYIPAPADLTTTSQTVDGVAGWDDGILFDAAIRVGIKSPLQDMASLRLERDAVWDRIQQEAALRNVHVHNRIIRRPPWRRRPSDTEDMTRFDPSDWSPT